MNDLITRRWHVDLTFDKDLLQYFIKNQVDIIFNISEFRQRNYNIDDKLIKSETEKVRLLGSKNKIINTFNLDTEYPNFEPLKIQKQLLEELINKLYKYIPYSAVTKIPAITLFKLLNKNEIFMCIDYIKTFDGNNLYAFNSAATGIFANKLLDKLITLLKDNRVNILDTDLKNEVIYTYEQLILPKNNKVNKFDAIKQCLIENYFRKDHPLYDLIHELDIKSRKVYIINFYNLNKKLIKLLYDKSEYYKKEYDNAKNKQQDIINNSHEYEEYEKTNIENKLKIYHKKYDIAKNLADELYNEIFNELVMDDLYKIILKREY